MGIQPQGGKDVFVHLRKVMVVQIKVRGLRSPETSEA
jgi:hypothetical protein